VNYERKTLMFYCRQLFYNVWSLSWVQIST